MAYASPFVICIEASHTKGMGHLFRSLRLADTLRAMGIECHFVVNDDTTALSMLQEKGYAVHIAPLDDARTTGWERVVLDATLPQVWINDRLDTPEAHASLVQSCGARLASFDDAGMGGRASNMLFLTMPCCYHVKKPLNGVLYCGPEYLLLDSSLSRYRRQRMETALPRLLVSMGGSDTFGATVEIVRQLALQGLSATVVTGPAFAHEAPLLRALDEAGGRISRQCAVKNLYGLFVEHDLLICAGGMTPFEAASTGLPTLVVATEPHEEANAVWVHERGLGLWIGRREGENIVCDTHSALHHINITRMSQTGMTEVDGEGVRRCAEALARYAA